MKIDLSQIPEDVLREVRMIAIGQGVVLVRPKEYENYLHEDEEALELALPYIDADL